jgi:hypothetical protein
MDDSGHKLGDQGSDDNLQGDQDHGFHRDTFSRRGLVVIAGRRGPQAAIPVSG